jgi:transposase-like protein
MQQSRTKEEKQELVELYKQSGMSVRAFAEKFNLNLATFRNWLYKKQPETKPAVSLPVINFLKMPARNFRF